MKRLGLFIILLIATALNQAASQQNVLDPPKEALTRYVCFQIYWEWNQYEQGSALPIKIKTDGKEFRIWLNKSNFNRTTASWFFTGKTVNGRAVIVSSRGYNDQQKEIAAFKADREYFESGEVFNSTITISNDCSPKYDSTDAHKELMLATVVETMREQLHAIKGTLNDTITIANFNVDYPKTYVLVEPADRFLHIVTLHNETDYDSKEFEEQGGYPYGQRDINSVSKTLIAKIRKNGIVKTIDLKK